MLSPNTRWLVRLRLLHLYLEADAHNALSIDLGVFTMLLQHPLINMEAAISYSDLLCDIVKICASHLVLVCHVNAARVGLGG